MMKYARYVHSEIVLNELLKEINELGQNGLRSRYIVLWGPESVSVDALHFLLLQRLRPETITLCFW